MRITRAITTAALIGLAAFSLAACENAKPGDPAEYDRIDTVSSCPALYALHNGYATGAAGQSSDAAVVPAALSHYAWDRAMTLGCPSPESLGFTR